MHDLKQHLLVKGKVILPETVVLHKPVYKHLRVQLKPSPEYSTRSSGLLKRTNPKFQPGWSLLPSGGGLQEQAVPPTTSVGTDPPAAAEGWRETDKNQNYTHSQSKYRYLT